MRGSIFTAESAGEQLPFNYGDGFAVMAIVCKQLSYSHGDKQPPKRKDQTYKLYFPHLLVRDFQLSLRDAEIKSHTGKHTGSTIERLAPAFFSFRVQGRDTSWDGIYRSAWNFRDLFFFAIFFLIQWTTR